MGQIDLSQIKRGRVNYHGADVTGEVTLFDGQTIPITDDNREAIVGHLWGLARARQQSHCNGLESSPQTLGNKS